MHTSRWLQPVRWVLVGLMLALALGGCKRATPTPMPTPTEKPATATPTEAPATPTEPSTEEPSSDVYSEGSEAIPLTGGFDLDAGVNPGGMDPTLDFMLRSAGSGMVEVYPYAGAQFAFGKTSSQAPALEDCQDVSALSRSKHVITNLDTNYYVCYLTGGNRYGYLNFTALSDDQLSFNWHTFNATAPVFPPFGAERTAYAWQIDKRVPFETYLDLDEGIEVEDDSGEADFTLAPGETRATVTFTPVGSARFAFDSTYPTEPSPETCMALDDDALTDETRTLSPEETYNICYRTGEGRYGYVRLTAVNDEGVTLDLKTFDTGTETAGSGPSAPASCEGGELWFDVWPINTWCAADSEAWSVTIFVEGHGGDCLYTYSWQGEAQAGPMADSTSIEIKSGGGNIIGTATVSSAGQTAEAPVYVERAAACP